MTRSPRLRVAAWTAMLAFGVASASADDFGLLEAIGDSLGAAVLELEEAAGLLVEVDDEPDDAFADQVRPVMQQVLNGEYRFIRKVVTLNPQQSDQIKEIGKKELKSLVAKYVKLQKQNSGDQYPNARKHFTDAFIRYLEKVLSPEDATRYRDELQAREESRRATAVDNIVIAVEKRLALSEEQSKSLTRAMREKWDEKWSSQMAVFMYGEEYLPMPADSYLLPILNDKQKKIWSGRNSNGGIHFGWQGEFGFLNWGGADVEDDEAADPVKAEQDADSKQAAENDVGEKQAIDKDSPEGEKESRE